MPNSNENKSPKLYVGQTLYRDAGLFNGKPKIQEEKIKSIGSKYFHLEGWLAKDKFLKNDLRYISPNNLIHDKQLYLTKEEILEKHETRYLIIAIKDLFSLYNYDPMPSLERLRIVAEILGIDKFDQ